MGSQTRVAVSLPLFVFVALVTCRDSHPPSHPSTCALDPARIDPYGFERPHDYESYKDMMDEYVVILNRRSRRWSKLLQEKPQVEKNVTGTKVWRPLLLLCCIFVAYDYEINVWGFLCV